MLNSPKLTSSFRISRQINLLAPEQVRNEEFEQLSMTMLYRGAQKHDPEAE